jgi:ribonuclease G
LSEEILINVTPRETRVAVLDHAVVQELHIERARARGLVSNIYLGRVGRVLPGMQSAFIEIGLDRAGFLHVADVWDNNMPHPSAGGKKSGHPAGQNDYKPIEKILHEGQPILVQVIKDPIGSKGARLTMQISLAGRFLVFLPQDSHIGISQRIEDEAERTELRARLQHLLPPEMKGGFIIRTMAELASEEELKHDVEYLTKLWRDVCERAKTLPATSCVHMDLTLAQRILRDYVSANTARILVDSETTFTHMREFARDYSVAIVDRIHAYAGERPLFDLYNVEEEIQKALQRRVDLKSGGYLIIDQTEALTTVDVNTGAFVGLRNFDDTIFKTNLEAAQAIARQLCLRNLGGMIILDFIDMDYAPHREAVLAELKRALDRDRTRVTVNGFTQLGLVEMTRKRTRESLAHVICEPCPTCAGRGELKTAQTVCYEIMRELIREARQFNPNEFRIMASQQVIDCFLDEEAPTLIELEKSLGKRISMQVETAYNQEQYDIVLV